MEIVVQIPDKKSPGHIRRKITLLDRIIKWKQAGDDAEKEQTLESYEKFKAAWEATLEDLLQYVIEPQARAQARAALLDASEEEIDEINDILLGLKAAQPPLSTSPSLPITSEASP